MRTGPLPGEDTLFPFLSSRPPLSGLGVVEGEGSEGRGDHLFSMHGLAAGLSQHGWMESGFGSSGLAEDDMFQKIVISESAVKKVPL